MKNWVFVADVQQNHKTIAQLKKTLSTTSTGCLSTLPFNTAKPFDPTMLSVSAFESPVAYSSRIAGMDVQVIVAAPL